MTIGVLLTSFVLGLRHGVDWDHIAAITDLQGTAPTRRRGFMLSFLYAVGHAVVVFLLGAAAIAFGSSLPESVGDWMARVVGATLVALGLWVLITLARQGRDFRLQSRWMLVFSGTFAGLRRIRSGRAGRQIVIEHDHEHPHVDDAYAETQAHDHAHLEELSEAKVPVMAQGGDDEWSGRWWNRGGRAHSHSHAHSHELSLADKPGYGNGTATGIGVLHGIGVESPTQIAVFVASSAVGGAAFGLLLLLAWVLGLVVANTGLAILAGFGLLHAERNFTIYATLAVVVGVASIVVGGAMLAGYELLPAIEL